MRASRQSQTQDHKADFTDIYAAPDPRPYFGTLGPLDYQVPQQAQPVIEKVIDAPGRGPRAHTVLDLCCSYGVNAALLRHRLDLDDVIDHYADPEFDDLSGEAFTAADTAWFSARRHRSDLRIYGLDSSGPAIDYAVRAGLLDQGWAQNLEDANPSAQLRAGLREVGTVVCTGGVGYIGHRTFDRIVSCAGNDLRDFCLVVFVLRVFSYDTVVETLSRHGLVTERLPQTFLQRRFADRDEQRAAIHDVESRGLDPAGKEADGWFHAECYISRHPDSPVP